MLVTNFAERVAEYLGGSAYGQMDNQPRTAELPAPVVESVRTCVGLGHQAGAAMNGNDHARFTFLREAFHKAARSAQERGLTFGQCDLCWSIGYKRSRRG